MYVLMFVCIYSDMHRLLTLNKTRNKNNLFFYFILFYFTLSHEQRWKQMDQNKTKTAGVGLHKLFSNSLIFKKQNKNWQT